jgi:hypothetical protein
MASKTDTIYIKCGTCDKSASQNVVAEYTQSVVEELEVERQAYCYVEDYLLRLSLCGSCDTINLSVQDDGGEISVLYPSPPGNLEGLPPEVAKAYKAARAVRLIDPNAFAVLLGRVLEIVCLDRSASGSSLSEQLKDLATKGEIPGPLAEMAHQLRFLRNVGAHATLGELTRVEVPILNDLCNAILEYVYTAPHTVERVAKRIDELKKRKTNP